MARAEKAMRDKGANSVNPGGFRIDLAKVPGPILTIFMSANETLRREWTLSERLLEIVRLFSAFENECHT